jgi:hypothetical protein
LEITQGKKTDSFCPPNSHANERKSHKVFTIKKKKMARKQVQEKYKYPISGVECPSLPEVMRRKK